MRLLTRMKGMIFLPNAHTQKYHPKRNTVIDKQAGFLQNIWILTVCGFVPNVTTIHFDFLNEC